MRNIHVVGLTGQTGAGKSSVSKIMRSQGLAVIDCDEVSREVVDKEKRCLADMALEFSIVILNMDGTLNRKKLASIVFSDKQKLSKLNELIFPYIKEYVRNKIDALEKAGERVVVLDAPTLFESGMESECDFVVSVIAPEVQRQNRIVIRDHLTDTEARNRMASQHNDEFYTSRSQLVIVNDKDEHDLHLKTLELVGALQRVVREQDEEE
ncbi:MAG: dephospho-CoA kinase [Oscillospiraceae bacterium]|nr:dephospho-CoA kinase [Oscillospiraceae bacterium]MBP1557559.1 dephospho-CoA kinase [Oscillospiraceae bacterium]